MSINDRHEAEDQPLDPAAERVRRKLARLLAGSLGIMVLGLIAVFSAIVYRVSGGGTEADANRPAVEEAVQSSAPEIWPEAEIMLPPGAELRSVALEGARALLHVSEQDGEALLLVDLASGRVLSRRPLVETAPAAGSTPDNTARPVPTPP